METLYKEETKSQTQTYEKPPLAITDLLPTCMDAFYMYVHVHLTYNCNIVKLNTKKHE